MTGFVFGVDAPCRACHGAGERVYGMSDEEKRERSRELRRAKRSGETIEAVPVTKPCRDCGGRGYVPISAADRPRDI